jgi:peptidoglycan/LPS O-acetylase OafA/YrhL
MVYHLQAAWLPGGFTGVDVFFVISGYLITQQIASDWASGSFSFKNFYLRRIRRIAPALVLMLLVSSFAAWAILTPEDLRAFAKTLLVQSFSLQNFVFLAEGNYFMGADTKPLLHTWSLAVEEQFYLVWPLMLLFALKRGWVGAMVLALIAASFALNLVWSAKATESAFFLIFGRAWELAVGGALALFSHYRWHPKAWSAWLQNAAGILGLIGLGASFAMINSSMPFPGWVAILPVASAAVLLGCSGHPGALHVRLLSNKVLVGVGLLSYALYLWHWPILVFIRHLQLDLRQWPYQLLYALLTLTLSYASYQWVERPIRQRTVLASPRSLVLAAIASAAVLISLSLHFMLSQGAAYRYDSVARSFLTARIESRVWRCAAWSLIKDLNPTICHMQSGVDPSTAKQRILVWGDSHAGMWMPMLEKLSQQHQAALYLNKKNCRAVTSLKADCTAQSSAKILKDLPALKLTDIVLVSSWHDVQDAALGEQFKALLQQLTAQSAAQPVKIWLVIDTPNDPSFDPLAAYARKPGAPSLGSVPLKQYHERRWLAEQALFQSLKQLGPHIAIIDPSAAYCNVTTCSSGAGGQVWYRDATHLSNAGALAAASYFAPLFQPR